jgi:hypothetical protein
MKRLGTIFALDRISGENKSGNCGVKTAKEGDPKLYLRAES